MELFEALRHETRRRGLFEGGTNRKKASRFGFFLQDTAGFIIVGKDISLHPRGRGIPITRRDESFGAAEDQTRKKNMCSVINHVIVCRISRRT